MKALRRRRGVGVNGVRNEHIRALVGFDEGEAAGVVEAYGDFASAMLNAKLPRWFYALLSINKLVLPFKKAPSPGEVPDCRPVGVPQCDSVCIERALMRQYEDAHREHLMPQQLGVGVSGGIGLLVFGLRLVMELHPEFVYVSLDKKNAHNEFCRDAC